jgi:Na+-driven multidrug efflux pump
VVRLLVGLVNLILDPLLMFTFKLNVAGAAMATAIAQWIGAFYYAIQVNDRLIWRDSGTGKGKRERS